MNTAPYLDMEKCSVCSKMTASIYMAERGWMRRVCRMCKQRQTEERETKHNQRSGWKTNFGWVIPALVLGMLSLWHFKADMPAVEKAFAAISAKLGMDSQDEKGHGTQHAAPPTAAPAASMPANDASAHTFTLNLRSDVLFEFGNALLKAAAGPTLRDAASVIRQHPQAAIVIHGYTDSIGSAQANLALSQQRAESVRNWMVKNGVTAKHMSVVGMGAKNPVAPNTKPDGSDNPAGREQNRRVTISVSGS
jgi:outer membrane protein OmpA-like peptidoglycan-associated protein